MTSVSTSQSLSRTELIRGRRSAEPARLRPPFALAEPDFLATCTRCDACLTACPEGIVRRDRDGLPMLDFSGGECSFCGDCLAACEPEALSRTHGRPWQATAAIGTACLALEGVVCRLCEEACEPRAIRFAARVGAAPVPAVDHALCSGCGACVGACPAAAIAVTERTAA